VIPSLRRDQTSVITWSVNFETGHPDIDREHQGICERLNQIELAIVAGAGRAQVAEMVSVLLHYTLVHFRREELAMACAKCPLRGENCLAHAKFVARLEHWLEVMTIPGTNPSILRDVHAETCRWIEQHLLQTDSALRSARPPGE
jgi:hemerythrin